MTVIFDSLFLMLAYPLLAIGISLASFSRTRLFSFIPCGVLLAGSYLAGFLALLPLLGLVVFMVLAFLYVDERCFDWLGQVRHRRWLLYGGIVPLALLIGFRVFPGVANPLLYGDVQLSSVARPFSIYLSLDKGVLALLLWMVASSRLWPGKMSPVSALWLLPLMLGIILSVGVMLGYVAPDLKWPGLPLFASWALANLLVTCVLEEAFFRGIVQRGLMTRWQQYRYGPVAALVVASLLFGIAHAGGDWMFVLLATLAGLFYGAGYWLTGRLWFAVLLHFSVNLVTFIGFSYPALL